MPAETTLLAQQATGRTDASLGSGSSIPEAEQTAAMGAFKLPSPAAARSDATRLLSGNATSNYTVSTTSAARNRVREKLQMQGDLISQLAAEFKVPYVSSGNLNSNVGSFASSVSSSINSSMDFQPAPATRTALSPASLLLAPPTSSNGVPRLRRASMSAVTFQSAQLLDPVRFPVSVNSAKANMLGPAPYVSPRRVSVQLSSMSAAVATHTSLRTHATVLSESGHYHPLQDAMTAAAPSALQPLITTETVLSSAWQHTSDALVKEMDALLQSCKELTKDINKDLESTDNELISIGTKLGRTSSDLRTLVHAELATSQAVITLQQQMFDALQQTAQ
ncbi:hypothetical protein RI367_003579 [Sorochytrium milnesiophthora]